MGRMPGSQPTWARSASVHAPAARRKRPAGRRQLDASNAPNEQLCPDLGFQIAYLPAEGGLRRVQPALGRERQAALLGDRNKKAQVP